jgi:DNA-binding FrmR family transcriptional regulator
MLFNKKKKIQNVGKHFKHSDLDKQKFSSSINKLIGQLETIKSDIVNDNACDETLIQVLAIKGGVEKVGRELIGKGILDCLDEYSKEELELIFKNLFKLD